MDITKLTKLETALSGNSYESGAEVSKILTHCFNGAGSFKRIMRDIVNTVSEKNKQKLFACLSLMMLDLGYSYTGEDKGWYVDDRKIASQRFAARNLDFFKKDTERYLGFFPELNEEELEKNHILYKALRNPRKLREAGSTWIIGLLETWIDEHSTLQQALVNGYVNGILLETYPEGTFRSNSDRGGICFPYI